MASEEDGPSGSTWAQARESSHQMILQSALEDLESKAAQWEQELMNAKATVDSQKTKIETLEGDKSKLQTTLEEKTSEISNLKSNYQEEHYKAESMEEAQLQSMERTDRLQAESDTLREEIR